MAITSIESTSERSNSVAVAAVKAAHSTQLASLQATLLFTETLLLSPLFATRFIVRTAAFVARLVERQVEPRKELAPNASLVTIADDAADLAAQGVVEGVDAAVAPECRTKTDTDQAIQLRAERLVVNKQFVRYGETRVLKKIVTEIKPIDVRVNHEELVIDRQAMTGNGDIDDAAEPITDDAIRIPLTEEKVSVSTETVVREEVELGNRRVDDVEHISATLRHEELRADCATINPSPGANLENLVPTDNPVALVTMLGPTTASAEIERATLHERIQNRAYALWEGEGRSEGRQLDHWVQAEREIFAMLTPSMDLRSVLRHAA